MVPADGVPIEAGVRDLHDERVAAPLDAGRHLLHDQAGRMFVDLLEQARAHALAVEALLFRGDGAQKAASRRHRQVVHRRHEPFLQRWRALDHLLRVGKRNLRLVELRGREEDLRVPLAVGDRAIQHQPDANGVFPEPFAISM
jgi:hypothetical protein